MTNGSVLLSLIVAGAGIAKRWVILRAWLALLVVVVVDIVLLVVMFA